MKVWLNSTGDQSFRQKQLLRRHKNLYHTPDYVPPAPKEKSHECGDCNKVGYCVLLQYKLKVRALVSDFSWTEVGDISSHQ